MDTLTVVREFLSQRTAVAPERVVPSARLADLGVDSLALLELMFECEERLGVRIGDDAPQPKTVDDLLAIVARLQKVPAES